MYLYIPPYKKIKKIKLWKKILISLLILLCIAVIDCTIYINDYYHANDYAMTSIESPESNITVRINEDRQIIFEPENPVEGIIFYPGGKVEYEAYAPLMVLSVYGSEDGVLKIDSYEKYKSNLPETFNEIVITGGCHAYFGCYGPQKEDNTPAITNEEQIRLTSQAIADFITN